MLRPLPAAVSLALAWPAHAGPAGEGPGRTGAPCTLDRHCGRGLGCPVEFGRCTAIADVARLQADDRRRDLGLVLPFLVIGAGLLAGGAVFAVRDETPVAAVGLSLGGLLSWIGVGGVVAMGLKRQRHAARLREMRR